MAMLYAVELAAAGLVWLGLLNGTSWAESFVGFMESRFEFVAAHMELSKFPKMISGLYWSLAIVFLPAKSLLFLFAPFSSRLVGSARREMLVQKSGGSVLGLAIYVAQEGLQRLTRKWMPAVAVLLIFAFLYALVITLLPISTDELSKELPSNWPHVKVMLWEHFFSLSPVSLAISGSIFTYLQSAMLVAAVATASAVWNLLNKGNKK